MAYQSGLINDTMTRLNRRRSLTGRSLSSAEMTGIVEPMLAYDAQKSEAAGIREQNQANLNRDFALREKQANSADRAATLSGISDIGMGGANLYFANKYLNMLKPAAAAPGAGLAPLSFADVPALTAPGPLTGSLAGGAAGGGATAGLASGAAGGAPALASPAATAPTLATATAFGDTTAGLTSTAAGTGSGLAATAGGGLVGGGLGYGLSKLLGANEDITQALTLGGAGIGIGWAVGGPVGAVVGGLIGGAVSLFDDIF